MNFFYFITVIDKKDKIQIKSPHNKKKTKRNIKTKKMGNISACCDSQTQLDNISTNSQKDQDTVVFPAIPKHLQQLLNQGKANRYYRAEEGNVEKVKTVFCIGKSGAVYEGETVKDDAHGRGCVAFSDGSYFQGSFLSGNPTNGIFLLPSAAYYIGDIVNFQAEGEGIYKHPKTGYQYEGGWSKNLSHGKGKEKFLSTGGYDTYEGQFMYGKKFGEGHYYFANGSVYEGSFYNGYSDGYGKITLKNGEIYEGEWKLGFMHGEGKYKWPDGERYEGSYKQGLKHGKGKYRFIDGVIYEGEWVNGSQHGEGVIKEGFDEVWRHWQKGQQLSQNC